MTTPNTDDPLEVQTDRVGTGWVRTSLLPTGEAFVTRLFDAMGAECWAAATVNREAAVGNHRALLSRIQHGQPLPPASG